MPETDKLPQEAETETQDRDGLEVERDPSFVRIAADDCVVVFRGNEVRISLLEQASAPIFQSSPVKSDDGESIQPMEMLRTVMELAQVRMQGSKAFELAMRIIRHSLEEGRINRALFRAGIDKMLEITADQDDDQPEEGGSE